MKLREKFGGPTSQVPAAEAKKLGLVKGPSAAEKNPADKVKSTGIPKTGDKKDAADASKK